MAKKKPSSNQQPNPRQRTPRKKKGSFAGAIFTILIIAILTLLIGIYLLSRYSDKIPQVIHPKKILKKETRQISLYFSDEDGRALIAENKDVTKGDLAEEIKESIDGLIDGPRGKLINVISPGTRVIGVEVKDGIAYLNFSREISENHPGGSSAEIITIYSIVNTVILNFPEIKKTQLLIEGKKAKTLAGHIDISFPLAAEKEFVKG